MNKRTLIGITATLISISALVAALSFPVTRLASVPVAVVGLLVAASLFSAAGKLSTQLAELKGQTVSVQVWGIAPEGAASLLFRVQSTRAFGAGLHFWLESPTGGKLTHLKVAQPKGATYAAAEFRISDAAYVQWGGRKIPRHKGNTALVLRRGERQEGT